MTSPLTAGDPGVSAAEDQQQPGTPAPPPRSGTERRPRLVFLLVGVVLAAALAIGLFTGIGAHTGPARPHVGSTVPSFSLPAVGRKGKVGIPADGGSGGHPAVLLFFASWCAPCKAEVPALAATYRKEQQEHSPLARVALVGIDGSDPTADALAFLRAAGVSFPVAADRTYTVTQGLFEFMDLPDSVVVEGDGTIAAMRVGPLSTSALVSWQRKLLASG